MRKEILRFAPLELKEKYPGLVIPTTFSDLSLSSKSIARAKLHELHLCSLPTAVLQANQTTSEALKQGIIKRQLDEILLRYCPDLEEHPGLVIRVVNGNENGLNISLPWLIIKDVEWFSMDRKIDEFIAEQNGKQLMVHLEHPELQKKVKHVKIGYQTGNNFSVQVRNSSHARNLNHQKDQLETFKVGHINQFFNKHLSSRSLLNDSHWLDELLNTLSENFPDNTVCEIRVYHNGNTQVIAVD